MLERALFVCAVGIMSSATHARERSHEAPAPIVIAHRGASGYVPEHTLAAYYIAIQQGADYIEPDVVMSKDGVLLARHENEISGTTNVTELPQFAARKTTKTIDGTSVTGWFTEDFTLAELKTLRARERLPQLRTASTRFNDQFEIPTFDEVLSLMRSINTQRGNGSSRATTTSAQTKTIGVYPETKHPTYFDGIGLSLEQPLVEALHGYGYKGRDARAFIQSFEVSNLKELRKLTNLPLIQLIEPKGRPYDFAVAQDARTYDDLIAGDGLRFVATYADGIGVDKSRVISVKADGTLGDPTLLVGEAHAAKLLVHVWTLRAENHFVAANFRSSNDPHEFGDMAAEARAFFETGIDGIFTDHPNLGLRARDAFVHGQY